MIKESKPNNILLLTNTIDDSPSGGRELLCKLNHDILRNLFDDRCTVFELPKNTISGLKGIFNAFKGYIDGLTPNVMNNVIQIVQEKKINKIFVDGSNFGGFVKRVKKQFPDVQLVTFFHNVESRFFLGSLKQSKTSRALAVFLVNYLAERKSVKYSDKIVCINQRDSELLNKVYGRLATDLYPMSLEDKMPINYKSLPFNVTEKFALFVGGNFYANRVGIYWFVKNVAPHIAIKTYIVGRGFDKYRKDLETNNKVVVVGEVDSLAQWYHDAYFIIAPIFDGSGMKTKVAEALMYGKKIIGTPEAFTGYEGFTNQAGCVCFSAEDFVSAIDSSEKIVNSYFDKGLRRIYEENYSFMAAKCRLKDIMTD